MDTIKLTQFSHGGGCGCKIAPAVLQEILAKAAPLGVFPDLLVGTETSDDAAVYRLNDSQAIIATTDFFMPIVDDAHDFGRIAATNALSDIYAMGGRPLFALAVVGMPVDRLPIETIRDILAGGEAVCRAAGIPVAGGHSIDTSEPIYGLVAIGVVHPDRVKRNNQAQAGDVLILGKPLGIGILSAGLKKGELSPEGYRAMVDTAGQLNAVGATLGDMPGVHAMTDVTGFGLLGHLLEIVRGSQRAARIDWNAVPVIDEARRLVQRGVTTGAAGRNWASYGHDVDLPQDCADWQRNLLCDPQTSGGLLVACEAESEAAVLAAFRAQGFAAAATIGQLDADNPRVTVG
ncbi:MAG: selenide, water dikinase SelD [Thiobacillus sp. 65-29]|nr:MAG: selenide, water dikinase SelD [Thiobacillus sp. 65-29]